MFFFWFSGIVPSSVVLTGFQVMSRVFLTWAVTHSVREVRDAFHADILSRWPHDRLQETKQSELWFDTEEQL